MGIPVEDQNMIFPSMPISSSYFWFWWLEIMQLDQGKDMGFQYCLSCIPKGGGHSRMKNCRRIMFQIQELAAVVRWLWHLAGYIGGNQRHAGQEPNWVNVKMANAKVRTGASKRQGKGWSREQCVEEFQSRVWTDWRGSDGRKVTRSLSFSVCKMRMIISA